MIKKIFFIVLALIFCAFSYPSYLIDYNRPDEQWYNIETPHFNIYYLEGLREHAGFAGKVAENVYSTITGYYDFEFIDKVDMIVYDEDYANGWAFSSRNTMKIWIGDADFSLRGTHQWIKDVVTHEFSHLVSIEAAQKTKYYMPDIRFGYFDYFNENIQTNAFTLYSFDIFPIWFAEGIAQFESSRSGYDRWDTHRDMIMRVKALNNKILPLAQMKFFVGKGIDYESGPYNQGFSVVRYIEKKYGKGTIFRICKECNKFSNITFDMALKDALGKDSKDLYNEWALYEKEKYEKQKQKIGKTITGKQVVNDSVFNTGYRNIYPRWSKDDNRLYFLSNAGADGGRAFLYYYDFADTIKNEKYRFKLFYPGITGYYSISNDEKFVTTASSYMNAVNGKSYNNAVTDSVFKFDFFNMLKLSLDPNKKVNNRTISKIRKYYTFNDHILYAVSSNKGDKIAAVRKIQNKNQLVLIDKENVVKKTSLNLFTSQILGFESNKQFKETKEKVLFRPQINRPDGYVIFTPRFSSNDSLITFSYFDGKSRNIGIVDMDGNFTDVLNTKYDERDPDFSFDNKHVFFSSDKDGVFNIYRYNLKTKEIEKMSNVIGGAFQPAVSNDNKKIAYSYFDTSGYKIYITENKPIKNIDYYDKKDNEMKIKKLSENIGLSLKSKKYFPIFNKFMLSPIILGEELISSNKEATRGKFGIKVGGFLWLSDPLQKNNLYLMGLMEIDKGLDWIGPKHGKHLFFNPKYDKEMMLSYENKLFLPTITFDINKFLIHDQNQFYNKVEEKYETDDYVLDVLNYSLFTRFQFFSPNKKLHAGISYSQNNVDFYKLDNKVDFEYTFFKEFNPTLMFTYLKMGSADGKWRQEENIDTRGTYLKLKYDYYIDSILVDGSSWQESFEISSAGVIHPKYEDAYTNHGRLTLNLKHARGLMFLNKLTVGGEADISVADRPINEFVYPGIFMKSYAFLKDQSDLTFNGRNTARAELFMRFPIHRRIRKSFGLFLFDKIYGMFFFEGATSAGIDPTELGRSDLDQYAREGRDVVSYMHREQTHPDSARTKIYSSTRQEMEERIEEIEQSKENYEYDETDKHVIYEKLPEDTCTGFYKNLTTLFDSKKRYGFGVELRFENYIIPGYPFFITLRYSHSVNNSFSQSVKDYFTKNPFDNKHAFIYFNLGFSFDGWENIDIPSYHNPKKAFRN